VKPAVYRNSSQLIASHAYRPAFIDPIFPLHHFASRLRNIGREGKEQILGYALLNAIVAEAFWPLPPIVGSICKLEIPTSFCTLLLSSLAACEAIIESALWLDAADSCVVWHEQSS